MFFKFYISYIIQLRVHNILYFPLEHYCDDIIFVIHARAGYHFCHHWFHRAEDSCREFLQKKNCTHSITRVQHLWPEDYSRRKSFCEDFLRKVNRDPKFLSRVIFSDESLFTREGIFNSHNNWIKLLKRWESSTYPTQELSDSLEEERLGRNHRETNIESNLSLRQLK